MPLLIAGLLIGGIAILVMAAHKKTEESLPDVVQPGLGVYDVKEGIRAEAEGYGMRAAMCLALAEDESGFDAKKVNVKENAIGLFQIRPIAFQEWENRTGNSEGWTHDQLLDPRKNVTVGIWYLWWIRDTLRSAWGREPSDREIITAYKGGITNVLKKTVSDEAMELTERTLAREVKFV